MRVFCNLGNYLGWPREMLKLRSKYVLSPPWVSQHVQVDSLIGGCDY